MWIKRPESGIGYEKGLFSKEGLMNEGEFCLAPIGPCEKQGPCKFCGRKGMCCSQDTLFGNFSNGCDGFFGGDILHHCAIKPDL